MLGCIIQLIARCRGDVLRETMLASVAKLIGTLGNISWLRATATVLSLPQFSHFLLSECF